MRRVLLVVKTDFQNIIYVTFILLKYDVEI
jgi:hypothetical protein